MSKSTEESQPNATPSQPAGVTTRAAKEIIAHAKKNRQKAAESDDARRIEGTTPITAATAQGWSVVAGDAEACVAQLRDKSRGWVVIEWKGSVFALSLGGDE